MPIIYQPPFTFLSFLIPTIMPLLGFIWLEYQVTFLFSCLSQLLIFIIFINFVFLSLILGLYSIFVSSLSFFIVLRFLRRKYLYSSFISDQINPIYQETKILVNSQLQRYLLMPLFYLLLKLITYHSSFWNLGWPPPLYLHLFYSLSLKFIQNPLFSSS